MTRLEATFLTLLLNIFLLNAQVSFGPYKTKPAGTDANIVHIVDINNDGRNDVILSTKQSGVLGKLRNPLMIYLQNAHDSLDPAIVMGVSSYIITGLNTGDVDNDGLTDIIVGYRDSVSIFKQTSSVTFNKVHQYHVGKGVGFVQIGDLNNDNLNDILVSPHNESYFKVYYQNNNGFTIHNYPKPLNFTSEVNIADISGDGLNDVVILRDNYNSGILVFTQNSSGLLNSDTTYYTRGNTSFNRLNGFDIGDLNGDGLMDIAASKGGNKPNSWINLWYQRPSTGTLQDSFIELAAYDIPEPLQIADFNCDGKNEILTIHGGWHAFSIYEQDNNGLYNNFVKYTLPYATHYHENGFDIGDLNNDGLKDLAIADYNHGLVLLYNQSTPHGATYDSTLVSLKVDTLNSHLSTSKSTLHTTTVDTVDGYLIITHKTFGISTTTKIDSIRYFRTTLSHSIICGNHFFDTLYTEDYQRYHTVVASDTTLLKVEQEKVNPILDIQLFPNPTSGQLTLKLPTPLDNNEVQLRIHSIHGSLLRNESISELGITRNFDISDFANGVYLVKLKIGSYDYFTRVVKE